MRIHRYVSLTAAEGPGQRFCLWVQGCPHHCPGCFNPETWAADGGVEIAPEEMLEKILAVRDRIEGITLLGGEPFEQPGELAWLCEQVQKAGLGVLAFTGYTLETLKARCDPATDRLLRQVDLLLDGPYIQAKQDFSRPWIGSSNQRFLYLTDRYRPEQIAACQNRLEVRVGKDGVIQVNGIAPPHVLEALVAKLTESGNP